MYVFKRGKYWYFRMRVPKEFTSVVGTQEIQRSLKTPRKSEAREAAKAYHLAYSSAFLKLRIMLLTGASLEELRVAFARLTGQQPPVASKPGPSLTEIIERFLEENKQAWAPMTFKLNQTTADLMQLAIGDPPIDQITREDMRKFRNVLSNMPIHAQRIAKGKSLQEMLAVDRPKLNPKTVNRNMNFVCALMNWATKEGYLPSNPATSLRVSVKGDVSAERKAFDDETVSRLILQLQSDDLSDHQRLIPIIGLYSGMRIEEIAQLRGQDIRTINGVLCFDINGELGSLKSINSRRIVPVHTKLQGFGFPEYVAENRASKEAQLWPALQPDKYGRRSSAISKWFGRYKKRAGIDDPKLTFHSLRHTFVNKLKQADVSEPIIAALVGHKNASITLGRYGKAYETDVLASAINKIALSIHSQ